MFGMEWTVGTVAAVDAEIDAVPVALRARLVRLLEAVENDGLEALRAPHVRHLEGKLWELRVRAERGIARGIYETATGRRVVVLHVFAKKSRKTPRRSDRHAADGRATAGRRLSCARRWTANLQIPSAHRILHRQGIVALKIVRTYSWRVPAPVHIVAT